MESREQQEGSEWPEETKGRKPAPMVERQFNSVCLLVLKEKRERQNLKRCPNHQQQLAPPGSGYMKCCARKCPPSALTRNSSVFTFGFI